MSGAEFGVDPHELSTLARSMIVLSAKLDEARAVARAIDVSQFGHTGLRAQTRKFVEHWEFEAKRLGETLQDVGNKIGDSSRAYREAEDAEFAAIKGLDIS